MDSDLKAKIFVIASDGATEIYSDYGKNKEIKLICPVLNQNEGLWVFGNKTLPIIKNGHKKDLSAFKTKRSVKTEKQIAEIYEFDREVFNSNRRYREKTVGLF